MLHDKLAELAQERGDRSSMLAERHRCFAVLSSMQSRGAHFDPAAQQVCEQVAGLFRG